MPLKLTFTKVVILGLTRKVTEGAVKISAAPSKTVMKNMGWSDLPEWQKSGTASSKPLRATIVEFVPNNIDQKKHAFDLAAESVRDFEFVRTQVKKGKSANKTPTYRLELHCTVDFNDITGAAKIERYIQTVSESSMIVTYEREPEQEDLPGTDSAQGEFDTEE